MTYRARRPIFVGGNLAYLPGDSVPDHDVAAFGYAAAGLVETVAAVSPGNSMGLTRAQLFAQFQTATVGAYVSLPGLILDLPDAPYDRKVTAVPTSVQDTAAQGLYIAVADLTTGGYLAAEALVLPAANQQTPVPPLVGVLDAGTGPHRIRLQVQQTAAGTLTVNSGPYAPALLLVEALS